MAAPLHRDTAREKVVNILRKFRAKRCCATLRYGTWKSCEYPEKVSCKTLLRYFGIRHVKKLWISWESFEQNAVALLWDTAREKVVNILRKFRAKRCCATLGRAAKSSRLRRKCKADGSSKFWREDPHGMHQQQNTVPVGLLAAPTFEKPWVSELVNCCFKPSQPQRITSVLNTNFTLSPSYSFHKSSYYKSYVFWAYLYSAGAQHGNLHSAGWPILFCGPNPDVKTYRHWTWKDHWKVGG